MPSEEGYKNLIPASKQSKEEARENGRKGGIASGKARREKRKFKELLELAFAQKIKNKDTGEERTKKEVTMIVLADKCIRGDLKAIELAQSMLGEASPNKVEITGKDGNDLFKARRLSKEEARELMEDMDQEY